MLGRRKICNLSIFTQSTYNIRFLIYFKIPVFRKYAQLLSSQRDHNVFLCVFCTVTR